MSRLDRLVTIIETGSTPFIRNTAADQLSDLAKQHPEEIINLLSRVYPYLSHKKWETRITAARAFGGIVSHAREWDPNENIDRRSGTNDNGANSNNNNDNNNDNDNNNNNNNNNNNDNSNNNSENCNNNSENGNNNDNDNDDTKIKMEIDDEFNRIKKEEDNDESDRKFLNLLDTQKYEDNLLSFQDWNLSQMLQSGRVLLASSGSEYNIFKSNEEYNQEFENQAKKRKTDFTKKLGLDEVKLEEKSEIQPKIETVKVKKEDDNSEIPHKQSARMRALAKRKAKSSRNNANKNIQIDLSKSSVSAQLSKDGIDHINDSTNEDDKDNLDRNANANEDNNSKKLDVEITSQANGSKLVVEHKAPESALFQEHARYSDWVWQFQGVFELLIKDLFNEVWEIRHGCAMALREIIKYQAKCAGRVKGKSREENDVRNNKTLEDLCVRLLALFTMDRFGDYVSDTVIAPVRENAGQVMAALLLNLSEEIVLKTFDALSDLIKQDLNQLGIKMPCWEAKHGGMLGLRYFVSIRKDLLFNHPELLDRTIQLVLLCLNENGDDDVQTVAAATLIPITNEFVKLKLDLVLQIVNIIWKNLTDLKDDLSASIGSVMDLLAKLCQHDEVLDKMKKFAHLHDNYNFRYLIPRLYPFLRHSITNVRKSVLKTLLAFLSINDNDLKNWIDGKIFRLLFQNFLVEQNEDVLNLSMEVYIKLLEESNHESMDEVFKYHCIPLLSLTMTPIGVQRFNFSMNTKFILRPSGNNLTSSDIPLTGYNIEETLIQENKKKRKSVQLDAKKPNGNNNGTVNKIGIPDSEYDLHINIDAPMINGDVTLVGYETLIRSRLAASRAMGLTLASYNSISSLIPIFEQLNSYLNDSFSTPRLLSATIIDNFFQNYKDRPEELTNIVSGTLHEILTEPSLLPFFRESIPTLKALRTQCTQLLNSLRTNGRVSSSKIKTLAVLVAGESDAGPGAFNVTDAESLVGKYYDNCIAGMSSIIKIQFQSVFEDAKYRVNQGIHEVKNAQDCRCIAVLAAFADASLRVDGLPKKLNPVIRSLMDSVKTEESLLLQKRTSESVSYLVELLVQGGKMNVVDKLIKNLCGFLCVDTSEVPEFLPNKDYTDIVLSLKKDEPKTDPNEIAEHEKEIKLAIIKRRGGKLSLEKLFDTFGIDLFNKLPKIFKMMLESLEVFNDENKDSVKDEVVKDVIEDVEGQSIIDSFELIRSMFKHLHISLRGVIFKKFGLIIKALKSNYSVFRYSASKCFASICNICPSDGFQILVKSIIPMLNNPINLIERQGAIETIYHITNLMGSTILPYVVFLIVPVLGRMSDSNNDVRILATTTFASIIKLVPLEAGIPDPVDMPRDLLEGRDREREFIQQMMDPSKIKSFELPISIKATLRKYQQEGVNWLYFLNKYHLHGILCDDMGLGKTLQTICIISSDHYLRNKKFAETGSIESRKLPSLIICPPSLTGHWEQEFSQYSTFMKVLVYAGPPSVRTTLRNRLKDETNIDVIVTSYDVARNDVEYISKFDYNYCVLDEGHIIKNANTRLTKCVKMIKANHRLILSGTPIQNNVLELWSLFDFLMPGFLGSEKNFQEKFAKPIAISRTNKGVKEQERGALALESLHKQVLPFMLRRLKEDVLSDLPPKIIQDYYCELSNLQKQLYKDFIKKQKTSIEEDIKEEVDSGSGSTEGKQHVFQVLQYMRKLCNHPSLVLKSSHPQFKEVNEYLQKYKMNINDIEHAPKLLALKNLLKECGIGLSDNNNEIISQHRALVFCQMKDMLDIVENDLLKKHMKNVSYLRMDGSTDPRYRQDIVRKFNDDPSIDVLLLTTKVGGLGLNLTGADTVIFVEHDWNPMNDLQAMDRAHRLGQKKVVNVYRLITKNTLEEKIMGLQKFKMNIASTIVNQQNSGLASMDTHQLLDLFDGDEKDLENPDSASHSANASHPNNGASEGHSKKQKRLQELADVPNEAGLTGKAGSAVKDLSALWDESQYEEEYNLDTFIKTLT